MLLFQIFRFRFHLIALVLGASLLAMPTRGQAAEGAGQYLRKPDSWFAGDEAKRIAANILSYQSELGGWPKNTDTTSMPYTGEANKLKPTFDNSATTDEMRYLARIYRAVKDEKYAKAFGKGLDYILKAQYSTGGWPQFYPPPTSYHRHITFNDDAMTRLMIFLREVATQERYAFVAAARRADAQSAFDRGIDCILKCQIKVDGKLTAWCAQHDEKDYSPRVGRSYELVSISGAESVGVVRLLMSLENPKSEVKSAIAGAVAWFESAKAKGIRIESREDAKSPKGRDRVVVRDEKAEPLWGRFYEIETGKPIFSDRDGIKKYELSEIGYERRNGYRWYGNWAASLLETEYPQWKKQMAIAK